MFMHMCVATMLLLLLCGDIEMNPDLIGILTALIVTFKCTSERKYVNVVRF